MEQQAVHQSFETTTGTWTDHLIHEKTLCTYENTPIACLGRQLVDETENSNSACIYSVCEGKAKHQTASPFTTSVHLRHKQTGQAVQVTGLIDSGAMVNVMDAALWKDLRVHLQPAMPSTRVLRMANGAHVQSNGRWRGTFRFGEVMVESEFEIFPSEGAWSLLVGKPMLESLKAIHDFALDTVTVHDEAGRASVLRNYSQAESSISDQGADRERTDRRYADSESFQKRSSTDDRAASASHKYVATVDDVTDEDTMADYNRTRRPLPPEDERIIDTGIHGKLDELPFCTLSETLPTTTPATLIDIETTPDRAECTQPERQYQEHQKAEWTAGRRRWGRTFASQKPANTQLNTDNDRYIGPDAEEQPASEDMGELSVFTVVDKDGTDNIFTRVTDPFKPARIQAILDVVQLGDDLTENERSQVRALIAEYADCFALSVTEVLPVPGAIHTLHIPENTTFSKKIHQRPLTPPQREYVYKKIDELLAAGAIEPCDPSHVKCVAPITLAHKAHEGEGLSLEELQQRVNEQCEQAGLPHEFDVPSRPPGALRPEPPPHERKWRICQNFTEINRVTEIAPMPQGDIRTKQQRLSGHRWVCTFDFASGFYAVTVAEESRPYTCFYIEGRGYFQCVKMPFGLTGAPSTFAHMTATHLHDLLRDGTMELFVDDGGTAGDTFNELYSKIKRILEQVRASKLSLSPSKSRFFATNAVFAGGKIGPQGVSPDQAKLTAVVDWERPRDALNLMSFLGLTSHFRDLIQNYARIEAPLRNLLRNIPAAITRNTSKSAYRKALLAYKLDDKWTADHDSAFVKLKAVLTSEPVLRNPRWDGTPFILTTDGCKDGFGAVLAQRFSTTLANGNTVQRIHPVAFASKRTSPTEEKYKPFILEFAALKFALDKFSDIVWGFPIELETDCQALRDTLMNDKLNATHARWRDGILAHQIIDVRHIPGKSNVVADGLSRQLEGAPRTETDGSTWTVCEDWEANEGIINDVFAVGESVVEEQLADTLLDRFKGEAVFREVIEALLDIADPQSDDRAKERAKHRAEQYLIENGKLWRMRGGTSTRARARVECITTEEATVHATDIHASHGHWGRDAIKIAMLDKVWCPGLDKIILNAIAHCPRCKNFGTSHLHALLNPITRRHPFELLVGDYLTLAVGKGGYRYVGLYLDTFSQHVWAFKIKTAGSAKTTIDALRHIFHGFTPPETFMTDGGKHFDNRDVQDFCAQWGVQPHVVAAYSPWINGLVEGTNKLLLHILKRLCAPDIGEDDQPDGDDWDALPKSWPDHLDDAVKCLNYRVLPALKFSPKELLLGRVVNTPNTPVNIATSEEVTNEAAALHLLYVAQQQLDGYDEAVKHAAKRKRAFDKRVQKSKAGEVSFKLNSLVQVYRSDLDYTFKAERKLLPKWSRPYRVIGQLRNSYTLETINGEPIVGKFHARRLRQFLPRPGTRLALDEARRTHVMDSAAR